MTQPADETPAPHGDVRICTTQGLIKVTAASLFSPVTEAPLHALIARLFASNAVLVIKVDRAQATIEIHYDYRLLDMPGALRTFSNSLITTSAVHEESLVRQLLERLPGPISRVERRRPGTALPSASFVIVEDLLVEYDPAATPERAPALSPPAVEGSLPSDVTRPWVGEVVIGGVRRIVNLTAAGGCLVMSIIGVVTPGIPTVPFVLATGYFLARSSPRLHERFRQSRFFGQMVSDYEDRGGLRWSTKFKTILFTVGLMVITVVIAGATLPLLIVVGTMGTLGIYVLGRIPTVRSGSLRVS